MNEEYLMNNPLFLGVVFFVLGLMIGSFLNVVIYRLPVMMKNDWHEQCCELLSVENTQPAKMNLAFPASHCPVCQHNIKAWENIPVISYLFLGGKCAGCKTPISLRYPFIELLTGALSAVVILHFGLTVQGGLALVLTWSLICLTLIDYDEKLLPDSITLPLLWLGLLANLFSTYTSLENSVIGAMAGYLSLWSVFWLFKIVTGKDGMGYGDFKLLAALGAWMGWQMLPLIIILSSLVGSILGILAIALFRRDRNNSIPFGPFLAIAGWIAFVWGDKLLTQYLQIFSQ
ncbi:MAG: prepilin peptidase [Pseudomonadales bacterium]|nr:prepilin peptidase [Pseudomonadales bacterium]